MKHRGKKVGCFEHAGIIIVIAVVQYMVMILWALLVMGECEVVS